MTQEIYLSIAAGPTAPARLAAVLAAGLRPAALLIRPGGAMALDAAAARPLVEMAQAAGIAALIADQAQLARTLRADGVHLSWSADLDDRYDEAREIVGNRGSVGAEVACDAPEVRHTAMAIAERGADYVAFPAHESQAELVDWWSEIFEVPCVAMDTGTLGNAAAKADFVEIIVPPAQSPADAAAAVLSRAATLAVGAAS